MDASALVKLVVAEPESWALADAVRDGTMLSSELSRVELIRSIGQLGLGSGAMQLGSQVLENLALHKVERTILDRAARLDPPHLRSLDAIHLATALSVPGLHALVTYDRRLASAAELAGLRVESPA
jgi:predicted nucleic acid-binding protein